MNCEDLMSMKQIRDGMKLVAGKKGITRNIRWIYFADCIPCLSKDVNILELIHGEELVIVTDISLTGNDDKIIGMIEAMQQKNIAGFVINEGQISAKVIDYCNEIELPLFELSIDLHLIDVSQIICKALVEEGNFISSRERILSTILYSDNLSVEEIKEQAAYVGISLLGKIRAIVIQMYEQQGHDNKTVQVDENWAMEVNDHVMKCIKNEFRAHGLSKLLALTQLDKVIILVPEELFTRECLNNILVNIINKVEGNYHIRVKIGVGTTYEYIIDFRKSFKEAQDALIISCIYSEEKKIYFYEDLGIYALITQISNGKFLDEYVERHLGKLIKADQMQDGDLCSTLEKYLLHNCNANATAEELFIHRNTMRYRMDKVKRILENDLSDMSVFLELKLAFAIKRYRECREQS